MTTVGKADVNITVGSVNLNLSLKRTQDGMLSWVRSPSPPSSPIPPPRLEIPHFGYGCGAYHNVPGFYAIALNADCSGGWVMPGPREVAEMTGIAAGYRVKKIVRHIDILTALTYNGTNTNIYRVESGAWVLKAQIASVEGTDIVSFKGYVAVALGPSNAYQFTNETSNGASSWVAFTASTKTGNSNGARNANKFLVQTNGLSAPRVVYVTNPNQVYFTEDLSNGDAVGSTSATIGDNQTAQNYVNSIVQDSTGAVLFGMRHQLYKTRDFVTFEEVGDYYPDPPADAGGQSDRLNFEDPVIVEDRIYYIVNGYDLLEYYRGNLNAKMAPREVMAPGGGYIPRTDLPINAITKAGKWLVAALGSKNTATLKSVAHTPGGDNLLQNTFSVTSELYKGRYQVVNGHEVLVWHGILLQCTDPLRYMFYDEDDSYLYLASGDSESANAQMRRCYFFNDVSLNRITSGAVVLNTGTWELELGRIDLEAPSLVKILRSFDCHTMGLASTTPNLQVLYRPEPGYDTTTDYSNLTGSGGYTTNALAETGTAFPTSKTFRHMWLKFIGTGNATSNTYAVLMDAQLIAETFPERFAMIQFIANGISGSLDATGVPAPMSAKQIGDAMDSWQDGNALATVTDSMTGDSWSMLLMDYQIRGIAQKMELTVTAKEAEA